jgi:hypothetical protein
MNYKICTRLFFVSLFLLSQLLVAAQVRRPKPATTGTARQKQAPVKSFWGSYTGTKNTCSAAQGQQLVSLPLIIKDAKDSMYKISSYQFGYRRIGITEDEATGKTSPQTDLVAQRFTQTPLSALWQSNITEQLHKGEELLFFDIIVFDKNGRRFFAPELKITIE